MNKELMDKQAWIGLSGLGVILLMVILASLMACGTSEAAYSKRVTVYYPDGRVEEHMGVRIGVTGFQDTRVHLTLSSGQRVVYVNLPVKVEY